MQKVDNTYNKKHFSSIISDIDTTAMCESTDIKVNRILGQSASKKIKQSIKISDGDVRILTQGTAAFDNSKSLATSPSPLART